MAIKTYRIKLLHRPTIDRLIDLGQPHYWDVQAENLQRAWNKFTTIKFITTRNLPACGYDISEIN
jgi:hypothetical protein